MIINIRGTNGSGKTTLVRALLDSGPCKQAAAHDCGPRAEAVPVARLLTLDVAVVGKYTNQCGGMDTVKTQAAAKDAILQARSLARHVVFEGILISTIFGPWLEFSRAHGGMTWVFLDTPPEECLQRIYARNGGKPIKEQLVVDKYRTIMRCRDKALEAGERVYTFPGAAPVSENLDRLREML